MSSHFVEDYNQHVAALSQDNDHELAMAKAVGSTSVENFRTQGGQQVEILQRFGLKNGDTIYDLGCGSGRTAAALVRSGWKGDYTGADIVPSLLEYLNKACPGYKTLVHEQLSIAAADASLDVVYGWSIFTHLHPEETFLFLQDIYRALRHGGAVVFSFLEFRIPSHWSVFEQNVSRRMTNARAPLDAFLHRDVISDWAKRLGYAEPVFIDGDDPSQTSAGLFGQSIAHLLKP